MPAVLEIFNKDGSLRFSSERFKVIKFKGEFNALQNLEIVTRGDVSRGWYVKIKLNIPAATGKGLVIIPYLLMCLPQKTTAYEYNVTTIIYFDHDATRDELIAFCNRPAFMVGT